MASYHSALTLNSQVYSNKLKSLEIDRIRNEIEHLTKIAFQDFKVAELEEKVKKTENKVLRLKESNKEYEFLKTRAMQEKVDWKKKYQGLKDSYEKFLQSYPKILASKDLAVNDFNYAKQKLEKYEKETEQVFSIQEKEISQKTKLKESYSNTSGKIIEKLVSLEYQAEINQSKTAKNIEKKKKILEKIQKNQEKTKESRLQQEDTEKSLEQLKCLLVERKIKVADSPQSSVQSILNLYKNEEYKSISLSLRFNDLTSTVLTKKLKVQELQNELSAVSESVPRSFFSNLPPTRSQLRDFHEESLLSSLYASFLSFASNLLGKLRKIEENSLAQGKSFFLGLDDLANSMNPGRIGKKRSMLLIQKKKTILKSKTIREYCPRPTLIQTQAEKNNFKLQTLFHDYKQVSKDDLQFFLNNQIVLLCLKPSDAVEVISKPSGKEDLAKLYLQSHTNLINVVEKIVVKLTDALLSAREIIPKDQTLTFDTHFSIPARDRVKREVKFRVENSTILYPTSSDSALRNHQRRSKFLSDSSTPTHSVFQLENSEKELRDFGNRIRKIELNARKAVASNQIIRNEFEKSDSDAERTDENLLRKTGVITTQTTEITFYDIKKQTSNKISIKQVQELANAKDSTLNPFVLIFIGLEDEAIWEIRKMFKLHPLLDSECESSYFNNKDSVLIFDDYLFVTINDIDFKQDDPESPLSLKLVKHKDFILIFSEDDLYCTERVFNTNKTETIEPKFYSVNVSDSVNEQKQLAIPEVWLDISESCGCTSTEVILHRVLEAFFCRFETFILGIDQVAKKYMDKCRDVPPNDRVEFITKLSDNQKKLIYMFDLINPKIGVFHKLISSSIVSEAMKMYLKCFLSKTYILQQRLRMSKSMLNSVEQIYSAQVDQALYDYSSKLNQISKYFSAISAIFLPLNLITAYFGMNVMVPGQEYDNYNTFLIVCGICVLIFLLLFVYYKLKKWI